MSAISISILIPVYNTAAVLDETLDSALAEAATINAEVIAIDDGSTDGSDRVLASRGSALRYARQANQGVSATRNTLATMSEGSWLVFLDADDLLVPGTLLARVQALAQHDADAVYCNWQAFNQSASVRQWGRKVEHALTQFDPDPALAIFSGFWSPPGAWMFRRSLHQAIGGFRADLPVIQDARYALDAALAGARLVHAPHIGMHYREGQSASLSQRDPSRFALDCLLNTRQVEAIFQQRQRLGAGERRALAQTYEFAARQLARSHPDVAVVAMHDAIRHANGRPSKWLRGAQLLSRFIGARRGLGMTAVLSDVRSRLRVRS
jgi:GT2 family glycosyltransferase